MAEAFDTHSAYRELTADDRFKDDQAEALVQVINGAITGNVATKSDIENLQVSTKSDIDSVRSDIENLREITKVDIENLQASTKSEIELLREEIKTFKSELRGDMARFRLHVILWVLSGTGLLLLAREILGNMS